MAKLIDMGLAPPDHPVYSRGLRVKGKRFINSKQNSPGQKKPDPELSQGERDQAKGNTDQEPSQTD